MFHESALLQDTIRSALAETGLMVDAAFLEACSRCGVEPFDLQPRTEESFRRPSDEVNDPKVLALRFEGFEKVPMLRHCWPRSRIASDSSAAETR